VLVLVQKLIAELHLQEQLGTAQIFRRTRTFVLPSLLQVNTLARAIKRHFPLLAAALRANLAMNRQAKALLFPCFANRTTQLEVSPSSIIACTPIRRARMLLFGVPPAVA
jgi:hypothetical protein